MKIHQEKVFQPVIITLETEEEMELLITTVKRAYNTRWPYVRMDINREFEVKLLNALSSRK